MGLKSKFLSFNKRQAIEFYKNHKYRKCNGFFDAKIRGSDNRMMIRCLMTIYGLSPMEIEKIDEEINMELGRE